jgi:ribonucleotide monophosphatase NagD (HAD superfamily)
MVYYTVRLIGKPSPSFLEAAIADFVGRKAKEVVIIGDEAVQGVD